MNYAAYLEADLAARQIEDSNLELIMFRNFKISIPLNSFEDTAYLTGLRGYAALAVFFIHSGGAGLRQVDAFGEGARSLLNRLVDFGKYGVVVFFVLSAYTIAMSLDRDDTVDYKTVFGPPFVSCFADVLFDDGICFLYLRGLVLISINSEFPIRGRI
ncbi:MAG: acyltransferase family protein [Bdellovibrionaceae bacterium]|nr:acyltransferase family protein [Pseudobdellovibrionaceae bacterium]